MESTNVNQPLTLSWCRTFLVAPCCGPFVGSQDEIGSQFFTLVPGLSSSQRNTERLELASSILIRDSLLKLQVETGVVGETKIKLFCLVRPFYELGS